MNRYRWSPVVAVGYDEITLTTNTDGYSTSTEALFIKNSWDRRGHQAMAILPYVFCQNGHAIRLLDFDRVRILDAISSHGCEKLKFILRWLNHER